MITRPEEVDIMYRSPVPGSLASFGSQQKQFIVPKRDQGRGSHRHTASIASLIRGDERGPEDGWSPVSGVFVIPHGWDSRV
ncbi:uncharacterized protein LACBIDRAFT_313456 [Laccaria bicolor S238N-H82]|uniref:Predicted protein n=1 Tax=Laccaria bicolor (strain S238N-H82 / ATCC MYA-4686) TaxID=486041 RepID=B0D029_LACBS|nr:uncharacterized protein LACBIDRAFT_313456 [Laccaria bicolor S238N-H82]EDR11756.1 predicted protein [Laccaria bicolor S238N-H82]|eukprot:XP_001877653.1 predicted protein [Laccaria bicolor S238N-H82]